MGAHMGHNQGINVPDFLPAMQKALYVRLSQKHQRDGDSASSQGQRAMSKDEGEQDLVGILSVINGPGQEIRCVVSLFSYWERPSSSSVFSALLPSLF